MWGVLCLHLMGTMTTWMIPRMRERFFRVIAGHSIVDEARGGSPGLRHVWGQSV